MEYLKFGEALIEYEVERNISLNSGLSGKLLILEEMYRSDLIDRKSYFEKSGKIVNEILNILDDTPNCLSNISLFNGISGVGIALSKYIREDSNDYSYILEIKKNIITRIEELLSQKTLQFWEYDLLTGITGSLYFLTLPSMMDDKFIMKIIIYFHNKLLELYNDISYAKENKFFIEKNIFSNLSVPVYDLGISHGLSGILSFLCNTYPLLKNKNDKKIVKESLHIILCIYSFASYKWEGVDIWANCVEINGQIPFRESVDLSWCHGIVGIIPTLYKAYCILENEEKAKAIFNRFERVINLIDLELFKDTTCICHGVSSIIYAFEKEMGFTGCLFKKYKYLFYKNRMEDIDFSFLTGHIGEYLLSLSMEKGRSFTQDYILGM